MRIVEWHGPLTATVNVAGKSLLVAPHYCAHCRSVGDGEGECEHKWALFQERIAQQREDDAYWGEVEDRRRAALSGVL